jgi:hypothetical protein
MPRGLIQSDPDSGGVNNRKHMFANLVMNSSPCLYNIFPTVLYRSPRSESYPVWILLAGTSRSRARALVYPLDCAAQYQPALSELALPF